MRTYKEFLTNSSLRIRKRIVSIINRHLKKGTDEYEDEMNFIQSLNDISAAEYLDYLNAYGYKKATTNFKSD